LSSTVNGDEVSAIAAALDGDDVEPRDAEDDDNPPSEEEDGETFELVLEDVPPASHSVVSTPGAGPAGATVHTLTVHLGSPGHPDPIVIETGKIGRQASAAVTLTRGNSILYATGSPARTDAART
jgi:hypothetical protein